MSVIVRDLSSGDTGTGRFQSSTRLPRLAGAAFTPTSIAWSRLFWASGTDFIALGLADGANVATWPDEIGTSNLTQGVVLNQPVYIASGIGGKPSVRFQGSVTAKYVQGAFASAVNQPCEAFMVLNCRTGSGDETLLTSHASSGGLVYLNGTGTRIYAGVNTKTGSGFTRNAAHALRIVLNGSSTSMTMDSASVMASGGTDPGGNGYGGFTLGANNSGGNPLDDADIAFVGIISGALTAAQRTNMHAWAKSFYGTP